MKLCKSKKNSLHFVSRFTPIQVVKFLSIFNRRLELLVLAALCCLPTVALQAQYDTDGNGYAEVLSVYRDENNSLIWSLADLSQSGEVQVVEVSFGEAQSYPLPGYYLTENRAHLAVLRELSDRYELELQTGERRNLAAMRPDKFPVSVLTGRLDRDDFTDIAIIKQRSPHRFVWNVYHNPFQSNERRRRRFGSGEEEPLLAHSVRANREMIAGYLPIRGQRSARIRFQRHKKVLRFERTAPGLVDFSLIPLSLLSGYYFNSAHFSDQGRYIGQIGDTTRYPAALSILPGYYRPNQTDPEINLSQIPAAATGSNGLCEMHLGKDASVNFTCGLLLQQAVQAKNELNRQHHKNSSVEAWENKAVAILPLIATATQLPLPTQAPTVTLVPTAEWFVNATLTVTPASLTATPTSTGPEAATATMSPTNTSTPTQTPVPWEIISFRSRQYAIDNGALYNWTGNLKGEKVTQGELLPFMNEFPFSGGKGTNVDPYKIQLCIQLQKIGENLSAYYEVITNIDCSGSSTWNAGNGFTPVGTAANPFNGSIVNLGEYQIQGLTINRISEDYVGLFGSVSNGRISELELVNSHISGGGYVGIVAGHVGSGGLVDGTSAQGEVTGTWCSGGLVGLSNNGGLITGSWANAVVVGDSGTGVLLGCHDVGAKVLKSWSKGSVTGRDWTGGLVGGMWGGALVENSFSHATVSGTGTRVGGLIGWASISSVFNSYSSGPISGGTLVGGLVGYSWGSAIIASFWDTESSGVSVSSWATALTAAGARNSSSYTGWNFVEIWDISPNQNSGYPFLRYP